MIILVGAILVGLVLALLAFMFTRDSLSKYDLPEGRRFSPADATAVAASAAAVKALNKRLRGASGPLEKMPWKQRILAMRETMDSFFSNSDIASQIIPVDAAGVPAEWVVAPGADSSRRFLYIHGGAFMAGSPKGYRVLTDKLSAITNSAVLAIDYRLMPENTRLACVEDCRTAYDWMLENGPQGPDADTLEFPTAVFVAGDSAGGNLTLVLLAWARDNQRRAPNAALALSPVTDSRYTSPSIRGNLNSDVILKPLAKRLAWVPGFMIGLAARFMAGHRASDPVVSPLLGDLAGLPPLLVLASDCEILRDDGRRYVNKAVEAGTDATLMLWDNVPHVWPIFYPDLPEAAEALEQVDGFFKRHS
ncbi:putative acetyl-hydrolase [gamma proteobacterium HTCC2207]|mgnify:FL=1|uniref:Putative acetyl-hydrolase n=1 Tax=gamma proteobacterium HTCC2207 TaxID=314287 RepID=Q1YTZ7_9GAMM|nr:putative acetyl-hydrolase [gamma proteobacterium HTCC2207]MDB4427591.1 alpha/beta hydrolase [Porticoccaceae bacterium]MDC3261045.1 alpha/beta hydrolase [bacterium]